MSERRTIPNTYKPPRKKNLTKRQQLDLAPLIRSINRMVDSEYAAQDRVLACCGHLTSRHHTLGHGEILCVTGGCGLHGKKPAPKNRTMGWWGK